MYQTKQLIEFMDFQANFMKTIIDYNTEMMKGMLDSYPTVEDFPPMMTAAKKSKRSHRKSHK